MSDINWVHQIGRTIGLVLYLAVGFFYLTSGLVVPLFPWLLILNAVWAFGLVMLIRHSRTRWWVAPAAVAAAIVFWVAFLWMGDTFLGWTA